MIAFFVNYTDIGKLTVTEEESLPHNLLTSTHNQNLPWEQARPSSTRRTHC
jgi:hypothetical protein